jgi:hypothetical protein
MRWYEQRWDESVDFKADLIELLYASKFGTKKYTPYRPRFPIDRKTR